MITLTSFIFSSTFSCSRKEHRMAMSFSLARLVSLLLLAAALFFLRLSQYAESFLPLSSPLEGVEEWVGVRERQGREALWEEGVGETGLGE